MGALVEFDAQANWGDTHICDREIEPRLCRLGLAWGRQEGAGTPQAATPLVNAVDEPCLLYLRTDRGFVGVLCEAGEWVGWKETQGASNNARSGILTDLPSALPSLEAFLETMIELTGNSLDEG